MTQCKNSLIGLPVLSDQTLFHLTLYQKGFLRLVMGLSAKVWSFSNNEKKPQHTTSLNEYSPHETWCEQHFVPFPHHLFLGSHFTPLFFFSGMLKPHLHCTLKILYHNFFILFMFHFFFFFFFCMEGFSFS